MHSLSIPKKKHSALSFRKLKHLVILLEHMGMPLGEFAVLCKILRRLIPHNVILRVQFEVTIILIIVITDRGNIH